KIYTIYIRTQEHNHKKAYYSTVSRNKLAGRNPIF
ncbi:MAG: hypothetical protein ACI8RD_006902, partial [Bacillariaceae sp.]